MVRWVRLPQHLLYKSNFFPFFMADSVKLKKRKFPLKFVKKDRKLKRHCNERIRKDKESLLRGGEEGCWINHCRDAVGVFYSLCDCAIGHLRIKISLFVNVVSQVSTHFFCSCSSAWIPVIKNSSTADILSSYELYSLPSSVCVCVLKILPYLPNPTARAGYDTRSILSGV